MTEVIRFLELMGSSAHLRNASRAALYEALCACDLDSAMLWAILRGERERLQALMRAPDLVCGDFGLESDSEAGEVGMTGCGRT